MIYHCKVKDVDGIIRDVSVAIRGMEHSRCIIINEVSMKTYHDGYQDGYLYHDLISYKKEMESVGVSDTVTCVKPTHPPAKVLKPTSEGIMASWMKRR